MKNTRIAFIQRNWEDNLGILWISSVLKNNGFETRVRIEEENTYNEMRMFEPGIVGYSCYTGDQRWVSSSIVKLKGSGVKAKIIVGGPHATFFPEMIENEPIDAICRGEGEYAMLEYAEMLEKGEGRHDIQNLTFKTPNGIIHNELRPLVSDLDELPFPDRSYYDSYKFLATNPFRIFITGRGCPYKCTFCYNDALHQLCGAESKYVRRRSVDNVISELVDVRDKWGIDEIRFSDDHFTLSVDFLREFSLKYSEQINRPYTVNARADSLDEERISYLRESGCRLVCFGIETGREDLRNKVLRKNIMDDQIINAAKLLKKYGIKFLSSNIIGLPHEKAEDAWKTIEINQRIGTDLPWFSMMQYYPGTQIYQEAMEEGIIAKNFNVDDIGTYFKNKYLKQENIGELQNIHSFSILVSRYRFFEPIARFLAKSFKPNAFFRMIFRLSYFMVTLKRTNFKISRILFGLRYYLYKI